MAAITIRQLPDSAKQRLRMRAAAKGRSMEAEARAILLTALEETSRSDLTWIERLIVVGDELGGVHVPELADSEATAADLVTEP